MKGRKRHIVVDTQGLLPGSGGASGQHTGPGRRQAGVEPVAGRFPRLERIWADGAYGGKPVQWAKEVGGWSLELVRRPRQLRTFQVLPRRWVVERTFGWLNLQRRLSKDYEALPQTTEAWVHTAMTGLMLRRLVRAPTY